MTNMITGWFVSLMGLLGQQKPPIKNYPLNYIGVALCASCVIISSFIKNEEEEKEAESVAPMGKGGAADEELFSML